MSRTSVVIVFLFLAATVLAQGNGERGGDPHAFRVVDRDGKLVGYSVSDNIVAREIDKLWVSFYLHPATGIFDSEAVYVYFATADCTGTRHLPRYRVWLEGVRVGSQLYYPTDCFEMSPRSVRVVTERTDYDTACHVITDVWSYFFGPVASVEVGSFGLQPPFRVMQ